MTPTTSKGSTAHGACSPRTLFNRHTKIVLDRYVNLMLCTQDPIILLSGVLCTQDPIILLSGVLCTQDPIILLSGVLCTQDPIILLSGVFDL